MTKLLNTWKEASDLFVKPKIKFSVCKNWNHHTIWIANFKQRHYVSDSVCVKIYPNKCYERIHHKLPINKKIVWNSNIRRWLRNHHLSWIPPYIDLPKWLYFGIKNWDVAWKWKFDDIRHENNPLFEITLFGICFCWSACCPSNTPITSSDLHYWECILNYLYKNKDRKLTLAELFDEMGSWHSYGQEEFKYFTLRPEYLIPSKRDEYYKVVEEFKKNHLSFQEYI